MQVSSAKIAPSTAQSAAQVLLYAVMPLVHSRLAALSADSADASVRSQAATGSGELRADDEAKKKHEVGSRASELPPSTTESAACGEGSSAADPVVGSWYSSLLKCAVQPSEAAMATVCTLWQRRRQVATVAASWLPSLLQLHLALFYLRGLHFDAAKRAAGVRFLHVGSRQSERRYYGAMGALLLLQVAVRVAFASLRCPSLLPSRHPCNLYFTRHGVISETAG